MRILLDFSDTTPVYQQIRDRIVEAIADGSLVEGARLPTTRQLAADLSINFHTVARAYDLLREEGFIQLARRTGTSVRVTGGPPARWRGALRTVLAAAVAKGVPETEVLSACSEILEGFAAPPAAGGPLAGRA